MKSKIIYGTVFLALVSLIGLVPMAQAVTIIPSSTDNSGSVDDTFAPDESFYFLIDIDEAADVAGAALTIEYDAAAFEVDETNEAGEGYFIVGTSAPEDGIFCHVVTHNSITIVPSIGNKDTYAAEGDLLLSGAYIDPTTGGGAYIGVQALFKVKFRAKSGADQVSYPFNVSQTQLLNADAGWGIDTDTDGTPDAPENVPVIVGAVDNTHGNWGGDLADDYYVILGDAANPYTAKTHTVYIEAVSDDIDNEWELTHFGDLGTATPTSDTDSDGYLDTHEQPPPMGNDTDPNVQDDPDFSDPKYDASTDNRGPYQVVTTSPASPWAGPGTSFDMDVNYFTSDGAQDLSGLTLRIHYDSSKLTWNSVSDILSTGLVTDIGSLSAEPDTGDLDNDDTTDYYVAVEWSGGNWPGVTCTQESPAKLYTINFTVVDGLAEGTTSTMNFTVAAVDYVFYSDPIEFEVHSYQRGDVSLDGNITPKDATLAFDMYLTKDWDDMTDVEKFTADFNSSGSVTPADATAIFNEYLNR
jgi:hypothetical protein